MELNTLDLEKISPFSLAGQTYNCRVYLGDLNDLDEVNVKSDVYDGDTLYVVIIYCGVPHKFKIRLLGIDTPELRPKWIQGGVRMTEKDHILEKMHAVASRNLLKQYLHGKKLKVKFNKHDKYGGRFLADLYALDDNTAGNVPQKEDLLSSECRKILSTGSVGGSVGEWMIEQGAAVRYYGGTKKIFHFKTKN